MGSGQGEGKVPAMLRPLNALSDSKNAGWGTRIRTRFSESEANRLVSVSMTYAARRCLTPPKSLGDSELCLTLPACISVKRFHDAARRLSFSPRILSQPQDLLAVVEVGQ
jgi:hypothetical protein